MSNDQYGSGDWAMKNELKPNWLGKWTVWHSAVEQPKWTETSFEKIGVRLFSLSHLLTGRRKGHQGDIETLEHNFWEAVHLHTQNGDHHNCFKLLVKCSDSLCCLWSPLPADLQMWWRGTCRRSRGRGRRRDTADWRSPGCRSSRTVLSAWCPRSDPRISWRGQR